MTANPEITFFDPNSDEKPFVQPELRFIDPENGKEITLEQLATRRELGKKAVKPFNPHAHVIETGYTQTISQRHITFQTPEGLTYGI